MIFVDPITHHIDGIMVSVYRPTAKEFCCYRLKGESTQALSLEFPGRTIVLNNLDSECGLGLHDDGSFKARGTALILKGTRLSMLPGKYDLFMCMENSGEKLSILI